MKIDRNFFEEQEFKGKKEFTFKMIGEAVGCYESGFMTVYFELDTNERIGAVIQNDSRIRRNPLYQADYCYGWDGKRASKKEFHKTLCTRADYSKACAMLMEEYKNKKAE